MGYEKLDGVCARFQAREKEPAEVLFALDTGPYPLDRSNVLVS
jgi:hypothetical protein